MRAADRGPRWWEGAALYQIYVRSWRDSDGDGHGDLRGVIEGLDYLKWLGVDGIWLSPTTPSPNCDWGYDVSDYLGVHPDFGTPGDLDELIREAGRRQIVVLLDLVPNHTSDCHPWFLAARGDPASPRRGYYVWADPAPGGGPPNNWRDTTDASAWTFDETAGQCYLHNFLACQPDLNWWNPAVHTEFEAILRHWFDRGVAGVRIDVAHGLYKDALLRDNPPAAGGETAGATGLRAVYNANRPQTHEVYRDWRRIAESYRPPRLLLGETWVDDVVRMASYYGRDDELHLAFNFPFMLSHFGAPALAATVAATLAALPAGACPVWAASNHDAGRFPSRWCGADAGKARLALLVLATLPGTLVLYYGDELALPETPVPEALQRDQMTRSGRGRHGCRDNFRAPMPWDGSPSGGFTRPGATPWLPVGEHAGRNVAAQRRDPDSTLRLCRDLLALRRAEFAGSVAAYEQLPAPAEVWRYRAGALTVTANFSPRAIAGPGPAGEVLLATAPGAGARSPTRLGPWQGIVTRE